MTLSEFDKNKELQEATNAYAEKHGGHFFWEEPDGGLVYETDDGEVACVLPEGATADQVLKDLKSGKPLPELWPELEYDPDCVY